MSRTTFALLEWVCIAIVVLAGALALLANQPGAVQGAGFALLPLILLVMLLRPFPLAPSVVSIASMVVIAGLTALPPFVRDKQIASPVTTVLVSLTPVAVAVAGSRLHRALLDVANALAAQRTAIEELSLHDALTGAMTRRYAPTLIEEELTRARRYGRPLTLVYFRPVDFEAVRDRKTMDGIDDAIRSAADQIVGTVRVMDKVFHWEEAEFVLVLPETPLTGAEVITARLVSQVNQASGIEFAAGIVSFPADGMDAVTLVAEAGEAARFAASASLAVASQDPAA